jgi:large subunit ribosomal protein L18
MAKKLKPTYKMPFRRRREGKTDYSKRLALLKSEMPRIVVRKSLKYINAQIIEYGTIGDKTIVSATSKQLKALGWKFSCDNIPAAYLTGLLIAKAATEKKIKKAVLDIGIYESTKGSRIYAVVKGAIDGGLEVAANEKMFPSEDRVSGKHIAGQDKFKDIPAQFEKTKKAILGKSVKGKKKEK